MAEFTTLARPYAKAAFEYAQQTDSIGQWEIFLAKASAVVSDEAFAQLLDNLAVTTEQKVRVLMDIASPNQQFIESPIKQVLDAVQLPEGVSVESLVQQVTPKQQPISSLSNFIAQLADNDRLALLPEIENHYKKLKSQTLKQLDAYVTTAYPLTEAQAKLLEDSLSQSEQAVIVLHESVDSSLLGGATIKVGDKFVDGSIKGKLKQLKTQLTA